MSAQEEDVRRRMQALTQQLRHDGHATRERQREQGFDEDLLKSILVENTSTSTPAVPAPTTAPVPSAQTAVEEEGMVIVDDYQLDSGTGIATDTPGKASSSSWWGLGWLYKGAKGAYNMLPGWSAAPSADTSDPKSKASLK